MSDGQRDLEKLRVRIVEGVAGEQERVDFAIACGRSRSAAFLEDVYDLLCDDHEDVRYYALRALVLDSLDRGERVAEAARKVLHDDTSSRVRGLAASCIGSLYSGTKDRSIFRELRERLSKANDAYEAESVLEALYNIVGRPPAEWPTQRRILAGRIGARPPAISASEQEADELWSRFLRGV